jgi:O-antigen/teichoic acid export membrane protein
MLGQTSLDLHVLHVVRDPRGVAHSVAKRAGRHRWHPRYGPFGLAMLMEWSWMTAEVERWGLGLGRKFLRMRYEDLVQDPRRWIDEIAGLVGEAPPVPELVADGVATLGEHHTLAGNAARFEHGEVQIKGDFAWHSSAPVRRRLITVLGSRILKRFDYPTATSRLARAVRQAGQVLGLLLNRLTSSFVRFVLSVLVGRALGPAGIGTYYLFDSWQRLFAIGGTLGLPQIVLREVSVLAGRGQHRAADRVLRRSLVAASAATGFLAGVAYLLSPSIGPRLLGETNLSWVLPLAGLGAVFLGITQLVARALNGRGQANLSLALENTIQPAGVVLLLLGGVLTGAAFSSRAFLQVYVGLALATAGLAISLWRSGKAKMQGSVEPASANPFRVREMATFWILGTVTAVTTNIPYLILPHVISTAEIGLFGISQRFVTMAVTIANALTALFAPRFARHFAEGDHVALRRDLAQSQVYSLLAYAPFVLAYLLIPASLLAILGSGFQEASDILRIMVIGQSVNAATGLAATSLQMTRDEGSLLRLNLVFLVVGALAIAGLGWRYGLQGAAWGQSLALAGRNLAVYLRARASLRRPATTDGAV